MKKFYILTCLQSIVLFFAVNALYAQPGSIDSSLGTNGFITTDKAANERLVGIQSSGKLIVSLGANNFGLKRYTYNGAVDSTFGTDGLANIDIGSHDNLLLFAIQPNDNIVALAHSNIEPYNYVIARYTKNGIPDSTFGTNGLRQLSLTPSGTAIFSILDNAVGKIVLAGSTTNNNNRQQSINVVYLDSLGNPEPNFGINGSVTVTFLEGSIVNDLKIQPDGKIILVGRLSDHDNLGHTFDSVAIARYNTDGSFDKSFNGDGKLIFVQKDTIESLYGGWAAAVALQNDGHIIVAGLAGSRQSHGRWTSGDYAIWRLNKNGTFDSTFNRDGEALIDVSYYEVITGLAIDSSGQIIISGISGSVDLFYPRTKVMRLNTDGSLDNTFASKGVVSFPVVPLIDEDNFSEGIILAQHRIYVSGKYLYGNSERFLAALKTDTLQAAHDTTALPFAFTSFQGNLSDNTVQLTWQTSHEKSLKPFTIERGKDSSAFSVIGTVQAINTTGNHNYAFSDQLSSDTTVDYYYRIKSLDSTGITNYTRVFKFTLVVVPPVVVPPVAIPPVIDSPVLTNKVSVSPNPITSQTKLVVSLQQSETLDIFISNSSGRIIYQNHQRYPAGKSFINIPFSKLSSGLYYLSVRGGQINISRSFKK